MRVYFRPMTPETVPSTWNWYRAEFHRSRHRLASSWNTALLVGDDGMAMRYDTYDHSITYVNGTFSVLGFDLSGQVATRRRFCLRCLLDRRGMEIRRAHRF